MSILRRSLTISLVLTLGALLLAACTGGGEEPTSEPTNVVLITPSVAPDSSPTATVISPFATLPPLPPGPTAEGETPSTTEPDDGVRPGGIGTLVAEGTLDPDIMPGFTEVILIRTGGPFDANGVAAKETIILQQDGTITRNGTPGRVSAAAIDEIATLIDSINIFAVQANYIGAIPLQGEQPYVYQLLVKKGFNERLITAQDQLMPREIEQIIMAVLTQGLTINSQ